METSKRLRDVLSEHSLLDHPYYRAWNQGTLSKKTLRDYAVQYFAQVDAFPRFVSTVHSRCPNIDVRKVLLQNLLDEELHGPDHPELWLRFADALGASREEVRRTNPLPETRATVETLFALAQGDWRDGLCALYAYEAQVPDIARTKLDGLKRLYGMTDERALSFFQAHLTYDVEHSRAVAKLVDAHAEPAQAERATRTAAVALWGFLDGVSRQAGIPLSA
jgi:pyrroloquinoline-quinone synthase